MPKLSRNRFFLTWLLQKESAIGKPQNLQFIALVAIILGILVKQQNLIYLGVIYLLFLHIRMRWDEYKNKKVYENYIRDSQPKEELSEQKR